MSKLTIFGILNKIKWDKKENPIDNEISYRHDGALDNKRSLMCSEIKTLSPNYFQYESVDGTTIIPFHRILQIKNVQTNKIRYTKIHLNSKKKRCKNGENSSLKK